MLVRNTGRYALSFRYIDDKGREKKIEFDRRRFFRDTGNIATTGITELSEELHNKFMEDPRYKKLFATGEFAIVTEEDLVVDNDSKVMLEAKDKEIEELKQKLADEKAKTAEPDEATKKALEEKDNEILSLKAQLEALGKDDSAPEATDNAAGDDESKVTDGF